MTAAIKKYVVAALALSGTLAGSSKILVQCSDKQEQGSVYRIFRESNLYITSWLKIIF
jgi:hypothetical protein